MEIAVQLVIAGILQGGVYALAAFGLSLIFGVSDVLNLAHGEFLMLGGLFTFLLFTRNRAQPFSHRPDDGAVHLFVLGIFSTVS